VVDGRSYSESFYFVWELYIPAYAFGKGNTNLNSTTLEFVVKLRKAAGVNLYIRKRITNIDKHGEWNIPIDATLRTLLTTSREGYNVGYSYTLPTTIFSVYSFDPRNDSPLSDSKLDIVAGEKYR
jgi:hypothetical protein